MLFRHECLRSKPFADVAFVGGRALVWELRNFTVSIRGQEPSNGYHWQVAAA